MTRKSIIGVMGSIVLFIGVFTPILSVPVIGSLNYFQNGKGDGVIILILAVLSLVFALRKNYKGMWITGFASLCVIGFTFMNIQMKMSEIKKQMDIDLAGNPFRGIADMALQSFQIQWGFAILLIGAGVVLIAAAIKEPVFGESVRTSTHVDTKTCPHCAEVIKKDAKICRFCNRELQPVNE